MRSDPNTRNEIIYLKHAEATEVASLVSNLVSGQNQAPSRSESARRPGQAGTTTVAPATLAPASPAAAITANSSEFSQLVTILPDERSNAVVVSGTVEDIRLIKELIDQIDVLLAQVRIEVVIAEVTLTDAASNGISSLGLLVEDGKLVGAVGGGAGASLTGTGITGGGTTIEEIAAENFAIFPNNNLTGLISLATTPRKNNAEFLQVPAVVTTHNKEAEFFVGQDIPVLGSFIPDAGSTTTSNTAFRTTVNNRQVVGQREMKSFISVQDGEIIVMGGLQRGNNRKETNRLGPIPFIGDLLGLRTRSNEKTDLIFFLRPTILSVGDSADNDNAMERVDRMSNADDVRRVLESGPLNE